MKQYLITEQDRTRIVDIVNRSPLGKTVDISDYKKNRSVAQHRLYWKWNTVIGEELGESKEEVHHRNKEKMLVPIYERDDDEYAATIETVRDVYRQGMEEKAKQLFTSIVKLTSTTKATVDQMAEYLTDIEYHAASLNIRLPRPDDLYNEALGKKVQGGK